jgi:glutamate synthase domain-containing protein 2
MLYKSFVDSFNDYIIARNEKKCIQCRICERQCSYKAHSYDSAANLMLEDDSKCIGCRRCDAICPTGAIAIRENPSQFKKNSNWTASHRKNIYKQAETGGIMLVGMGNPTGTQPTYFDRILLDASQVTNPSIDPLREPMELRTYLGKKPDKLEVKKKAGKFKLTTKLTPQLKLEYPIMFSAMSYGAINYNVHVGMAKAAVKMGIFYNTGEGGLHKSLYPYGDNTIVQVASGRFGVNAEYLNVAGGVEIKIGQGAKPGIGGHLPGEKVNEEVSRTRMIPAGTDALSPAPHHDIYSIEDLRQLIFALKEATDYKNPVSVKISAVHNSAAIASGIARAGADIIALDGYRGGTGAAPLVTRNHVGIPIELALAAVDQRLRDEGIRNRVSIVAGGGIRSSADAAKAIALGADAVYIGTATLVAVGCTLCRMCFTGKCPWGIATNDPSLSKRVNPELAEERLSNLIRGWGLEIKEILGGMGLNALESLRGSRHRLRGVGLSESELEILGISPAGK